ncbi:MAG: hypothetical protein LUF68_04305 [Clostridiales bacterium]|nr:hypothetical protein [Clostridiales bacterium]
MSKISVIYLYNDRSGNMGIRREFYSARRLPMTIQEVIDLERKLREQNEIKSAVVCNIIQLADDDTEGTENNT